MWTINSFKQCKTAGMDGITLVMLQKSSEIVAPQLLCIYRSCMLMGYIPEKWKEDDQWENKAHPTEGGIAKSFVMRLYTVAKIIKCYGFGTRLDIVV